MFSGCSASGLVSIYDDCNRVRGVYELRDFDLRFEVSSDDSGTCPEPDPDLDLAFLTDLNRVVNLRLEGEGLVLRLDNDAGLMHFDRAAEKG